MRLVSDSIPIYRARLEYAPHENCFYTVWTTTGRSFWFSNAVIGRTGFPKAAIHQTEMDVRVRWHLSGDGWEKVTVLQLLGQQQYQSQRSEGESDHLTGTVRELPPIRLAQECCGKHRSAREP